MLGPDVILQIDKNQQLLLPLSVPTVCALVYHRLSVWADLTFFLTWQVGVVESSWKIKTSPCALNKNPSKLPAPFWGFLLYFQFLQSKSEKYHEITVSPTCSNTELGPRSRSFSSRCPFSYPILRNLFLASQPLHHLSKSKLVSWFNEPWY